MTIPSAITAGVVLEKNEKGQAVSLRVDLDIINDIFKIIDAWRKVQVSLNLNIDIKEKVNSLEKITFGAALVQFAKSIDKDIQLIPSITIDEDSLTQDIIEYMNSPKNNTVEDPKK